MMLDLDRFFADCQERLPPIPATGWCGMWWRAR